jgi:hypothetical protein
LVGSTGRLDQPVPCAKHHHCKARGKRRDSVDSQAAVPAAAMSISAGDPGSPSGGLARIAAGVSPSPQRASVAGASTIALPLKLVRSYQIPADDPSYQGLLNWSWSYDSAVSAAAFASVGDQANSEQLLDQLAALQNTDGSIDIAFNTATGEGSPEFRSGTDAWVGLAAATYDRAFASNRYLDMEQLTADYLLSLRDSNGLIKGGPDVSWVSPSTT